jgi:hypothetical protein
VGPGGYSSSIKQEAGCAGDVGTESAESSRLLGFEHSLARMAIAILSTAGSDGPQRSDAGSEFGAGGGNASLVTDSEHIALEACFWQHRPLDERFGIALQQY